VVRAGARPAVPRVWVLVALAAVILVGVLAVRKQLRDANDFPIYWNAARALLAGRSPYEVGTGLHGYVYLPWFAVAMVPLAMLPLPAAAVNTVMIANPATCWTSGSRNTSMPHTNMIVTCAQASVVE